MSYCYDFNGLAYTYDFKINFTLNCCETFIDFVLCFIIVLAVRKAIAERKMSNTKLRALMFSIPKAKNKCKIINATKIEVIAL